MAKPYENGKGGNSQSKARSQWVDEVNTIEGPWEGTKQNDFFYIDPTLGTDGTYDVTYQPNIHGGGGADQIIMTEAAIVEDEFFANMQDVTVLKFAEVVAEEVEVLDVDPEDDEAVAYTGSEAYLGETAQAAGIREVTGSSGDDVIDFSGYVIEYEYDADIDDEVATPLEIIIKGGAGADIMTASAGNDTFLWKAGDLEGTDDEHFDTINDFEIADDLLDISGLGVYGWQALASDDDTLIQVATGWDQDANGGAGEAIDFVNLVLLVGVNYDDFDANVVII